MKAEDLMVGNCIKWKDNGSIFEITIDLFCNKDFHTHLKRVDFGPIILSEEILLKCGYVPCSFTENHFNIKGHRIWKCNEMFLCDKNGVTIETVHQLQNLYKALTKQELEIKL